MQNLTTTYLHDIGARGEIYVPAGAGRTSFIDVRDIGECAAAIMGDPMHFGRAWTLTGSEAITYFEVAATLTRVLGRAVRYAAPTPRDYVRSLRAAGMLEDQVSVMRAIYFTARIGMAARVTGDTERLLGRAPTTFAAFARDHAELWRRAGAAAA